MIASLAVSALPVALAQATVASRSDITWASGTFETTFVDDLAEVFDLGYIPLAGVHFRGHGQVTQLGQPSADILDVLVHSEDLLHDQHRGERSAGRRHCPIRGDITAGYRYFHLTGRQPLGIRGDGLCRNRLSRQGEPGRQRRHDEPASRHVTQTASWPSRRSSIVSPDWWCWSWCRATDSKRGPSIG